MGNFVAKVFAVLKDNGIDTKGMSVEEAVEKYNEIGGADNWSEKSENYKNVDKVDGNDASIKEIREHNKEDAIAKKKADEDAKQRAKENGVDTREVAKDNFKTLVDAENDSYDEWVKTLNENKEFTDEDRKELKAFLDNEYSKKNNQIDKSNTQLKDYEMFIKSGLDDDKSGDNYESWKQTIENDKTMTDEHKKQAMETLESQNKVHNEVKDWSKDMKNNMLGRLTSDISYYNGSGKNANHSLWAKDEKTQASYLQELSHLTGTKLPKEAQAFVDEHLFGIASKEDGANENNSKPKSTNENNRDIRFSDYADTIYRNSKMSREEAKKYAMEKWNKGFELRDVLNGLNK